MHVRRVSMGIEAASPDREDEREDPGGTFADVGMSDEEPVLNVEFARASAHSVQMHTVCRSTF